jgi:multidrug efflux pump subunit AcrB
MRSHTSWLLTLPTLLAIGCARTPAPDADPSNGPLISVTTKYPGASTHTVVDTVAAPIEEQVNGVEGLTAMESKSYNDGTYTLTVRFKPKTDMDVARVLVQNRVSLALPALPQVVQREGVSVRKGNFDRFPQIWIAVFSPDGRYDVASLQHVANVELKERLGRVAGVAEVRGVGSSEFSLRVILDKNKLTAFDLTAKDVISAVEQQNMDVRASEPQSPDAGKGFRLTIHGPGRLIDADDFKKIIIKAGPGSALIRVSDVATVELQRIEGGFAHLDGKPVALISLQLLTDQSVIDAVRKALADAPKLPQGLDWVIPAVLSEGQYSVVQLFLPEAISRKRTNEVVVQAEKAILKLPGIDHCLAFGERETNVATLLVKFSQKNTATPTEVRKAVAKQIPGARVRLSDLASGAPFPVRIALADTGNHGEKKLGEWAELVVRRLADDGIAIDPGVFPGRGVPHLDVQIDRTKLKALGVSESDVTDVLKEFSGKENASEFLELGRRWQVIIPSGENRMTADDLKKLLVRDDKGKMVPIRSFTAVKEVNVANVLRVDRHPAMKITAVAPPGKTLDEVTARCVKIAEDMKPGQDYRVINLTRNGTD